MKKIKQRFLFSIIIAINMVLSSCTGKIGNTNGHINLDDYRAPEANYRLINDNTAYELISIEEDYIGAFYVDVIYNDPNNRYGFLPVESIAENAFKDNTAIFHLVILENILHIGEGAFANWTDFQVIYFQITQEQSESILYDFDIGWDNDSSAHVFWGANLTDFGYTIDA